MGPLLLRQLRSILSGGQKYIFGQRPATNLMIDLNSIDAIIFDFGGVILNLDYSRTIRAFEDLGFTDFEERYTQAKQDGVFDEIETGAITEHEFRNRMRVLARIELTDAQIDQAWNAMLLELPKVRLELLSSLKTSKRTFLLSNTNVIHAREFEQSIREAHNGVDLKNYFEAGYYSHEMGMRKPDPKIFQRLIDTHDLNPSRTLFIDDSEQHIEGAKVTGLQTHHLSGGQTIEELFSYSTS